MGALVVLRDPERTLSLPLGVWQGLTMDKGKHGEGSLSLSFPVYADGLLQGIPTGFINQGAQHGWGIDVWATSEVGDGLVGPLGPVPCWSGPLQRVTRRRGPDKAIWFDVAAETWIHHICRRRLAIEGDHVPFYDYTGALYWSQMVYKVLNGMQTGPSNLAARMNAYSGTRSDWQWFRISVNAAPTSGPQTAIPPFDSGSTVWQLVTGMCDIAGLALHLAETADGSPVLPRFTFTIQYPYTRSLSTVLTLSDLTGAAAAYQDETDYSTIVNTYIERGKGQLGVGDAQYAQWAAAATSQGSYGIYEGGTTGGVGDNSTDGLAAKAAMEVARLANPRVSHNVGLYRMLPGRTLGVDFDVRFPVTLHDSLLLPESVAQTITGWSASCAGPGQELAVDVTIGDPPLDEMSEILAYVGGAAGRSGGSIERPKGR